ncbi:hypothetical protein [Shewanella sp.]|uniref:hypothetical protein n=1 Tax=Shewanella sp. TaxID=50422 RepID=UPI003A8ACC6E
MFTFEFSILQLSRIFLVTVGLFVASNSFATKLPLPNKLGVKLIDGLAVYNINISSGKYAIDLIYSDEFSVNEDDSSAWVNSKYFYWLVDIVERSKFKLQLQKNNSEDAVYTYIKNPLLKIIDEFNRAVSTKVYSRNELMLSSLNQFGF